MTLSLLMTHNVLTIVLKELDYYGIEVSDESCISNINARKAICIKSLSETVKEFEEICAKDKALMINSELECRCSKHALDILKKGYFFNKEIAFNFDQNDQHENVKQLLKMNKHGEIKKKVDRRLSSFSLKLLAFDAKWDGSFHDVEVHMIDACIDL